MKKKLDFNTLILNSHEDTTKSDTVHLRHII